MTSHLFWPLTPSSQLNPKIILFELFQSEKTEKYHFRLKAGNGQIIGQSQQYKSESGRDNGIKSVGKNCGGKTKDLTE